MKYALAILITLLVLAITELASASTRAPAKSHSCTVHTGDIGTIVGRGADAQSAFSAAATICFERRMNLYRAARGREADMERGSAFIDSCANITCQ